MMYKLKFIPTTKNNLAIKSCVFVKEANSIEELASMEYEVPNPLEWMLESIEEIQSVR
jgi:hypothetical protein